MLGCNLQVNVIEISQYCNALNVYEIVDWRQIISLFQISAEATLNARIKFCIDGLRAVVDARIRETLKMTKTDRLRDFEDSNGVDVFLALLDGGD